MSMPPEPTANGTEDEASGVAPRISVSDGVMRIIVPPDIAGLADSQQRLSTFLTESGCDPRTIFKVELVVEEIAMNAIMHAGAGQLGTVIELEGSMREGRACLAIEDNGPAFDPLAAELAPLAASLDEAKIGGLGLRLVRANASALRYVRTAAGCNRLEIEIAPT